MSEPTDDGAPGRRAAPPLLPLFRSKSQAIIFSSLYLDDTVEMSISDLARRAAISRTVAKAEIDRLQHAGLVATVTRGRNRMARASAPEPLRQLLSQLAMYTYGPIHVITEEFSGIDRLESLQIYGSWAARYLLVPGDQPSDIDVLVVGDVDRDEVFDAAQRAERRLGLGKEVSPHVVSAHSWRTSNSPFFRTVRERPRIHLFDRDEPIEP